MNTIIYFVAIVFVVAFIVMVKKLSQKDTIGYLPTQGEKEALKQAEKMRCEMNGFFAKPKKRSSYFADHYGCGIHAVETYNDE